MEEKVLLVQGSGFNWPHPDHVRVVFLPNVDDLTEAHRPHRPLPGALSQAARCLGGINRPQSVAPWWRCFRRRAAAIDRRHALRLEGRSFSRESP